MLKWDFVIQLSFKIKSISSLLGLNSRCPPKPKTGEPKLFSPHPEKCKLKFFNFKLQNRLNQSNKTKKVLLNIVFCISEFSRQPKAFLKQVFINDITIPNTPASSPLGTTKYTLTQHIQWWWFFNFVTSCLIMGDFRFRGLDLVV